VQVIFAVTEAERSARVYERVFAWPRDPLVDYTNYVELRLPEGGSLGLYERSGFASEVGAEPAEVADGQVAPAYLYVRVDDVAAAVTALTDAGARPLSPIAQRGWGHEAAWFADPDGNVVAVAQQIPATHAT
jgi:predicted enzyme related to lactoylglutathione lyase